MKTIVELRCPLGRPSLYMFDFRGAAECDRKVAMRFTEEQAREVAKREKKLRPARQVLMIKVKS